MIKKTWIFQGYTWGYKMKSARLIYSGLAIGGWGIDSRKKYLLSVPMVQTTNLN